jgi:secreted PhoX family phosphatase
VVDEHRGRSVGCDGVAPCGGGVYKFVPETYGDLSTGSLYVLKVTGPDGTGQGEWVGPIDAENARIAGTTAGGQSYQRPEDLEVINGVLYVAVTEGPRDEKNKEHYEGRVISIDLSSMAVRNFVKPDVNVAVEIGKPGDVNHQSGFDSVDNLAEAPNGDLIMIEDNSPSDIWFASTRTNEFGASVDVRLFASLTDPGAEGTGIYFSPLDDKTLYVNVQHSAADDGDATWAITRQGK